VFILLVYILKILGFYFDFWLFIGLRRLCYGGFLSSFAGFVTPLRLVYLRASLEFLNYF
jgi:hypothetical protein